MKVIIGAGVCGFSLNAATVQALFESHPEFFDEPMPAAEFRSPTETDSELLAHYSGSALVGDQLYFLKQDLPALRSLPWLVAQLEEKGSEGLCGRYGRELRIVDIPEGVDWYIFEYEDGSEAVHERHRIWR